jgi:hypothetical protein
MKYGTERKYRDVEIIIEPKKDNFFKILFNKILNFFR